MMISVLAFATLASAALKSDTTLKHGYNVAYGTPSDTVEDVIIVDVPAKANKIEFRTYDATLRGISYVFARLGANPTVPIPTELSRGSVTQKVEQKGEYIGPVGNDITGSEVFDIMLNKLNGTGTKLHVQTAAWQPVTSTQNYNLGVLFKEGDMTLDIPIEDNRRTMLLSTKGEAGDTAEYWFTYNATAEDVAGGGKMYCSLVMLSSDSISDSLSFVWKKATERFNTTNGNVFDKFPEITPRKGSYTTDSMKMPTAGQYFFGLLIEAETGDSTDFSIKCNVNEIPSGGAGSISLSFAAILFVAFAFFF